MSDQSTASHIRRKKIHVPGTGRNTKYLTILLIVLFAALTGLAYIGVSSGILETENPAIPRNLILRINSERLAYNLPPVEIDRSLTDQAERRSQEIRDSPMAYTPLSGQNPGEITDVFRYPKLSWAASSINLEPPLFDTWIAEDADFQRDILNNGYRNIGIGIASDGYNYYIVTKWL